jgi:methionyl-tRNA formyltransferase
MGEPDACGVSVHLVDRGVDTGPVLAQAIVVPTRRDNFMTYPLLQLVAAIPLVRSALSQAAAGQVVPLSPQPPGPSRVWSHPTFWAYLWTRLSRGVR